MEKIRRFYPTILAVLFFFLQFLFLYQHTQTIHFNDELEHISGAWEIINQNKKLYADISVNHQPLPFLAGYVLLKIFTPSNLYSLIESSRLFLFTISFTGALYVTLRFRWAGLIAVLLVETIKYHVFGYHLLAESLAVYPILIMGGLLLELIFIKKQLSALDDITYGCCLFLNVFLLLPNIPFALVSAVLYLIYRTQAFWRRVLPSFLGFFIALSFVVHWPSWYEETVKNVVLYFLPSETDISSISKNIYHVVFPFLSIFQLNNLIAQYYFLVFFAGIGAIAISWKKLSLKDTLLKLLLFYVLITLLNFRIQTFSEMGWAAFHLLPQMALMTIFCSYAIVLLVSREKLKNILHLFPLVLILGALLITSPWWFEKRDKMVDHHIQYNSDETIGNAVLALKQPGDTLLSGPQHGEVNLVANLPFPGRQITYFSWAYSVPRLRREIEMVMKNNPPTFIYFPETKSPYYDFLRPFINQNYVEITDGNDKFTYLYIQKLAADDRKQAEK